MSSRRVTLSAQEFVRKLSDQRAKPTATLTGLVRPGTNSRSIVFSLLGRDAWITIPTNLIDRVDLLGQVTRKADLLDHVRIHLIADSAETISELLREIHVIPPTFVRRQEDKDRGSFRIHPFGIFGWNELRDNVTLAGTVVDHNYSGDHPFGDGDWNLKVRPDPAYGNLLINSHGQSNEDGIVECERRRSRSKIFFPDSKQARGHHRHVVGRQVTRR